MKGDFTRNTFDSRKHYREVQMQQGRVQLDADWNEQAALTARRDETTTRDVVGDCGGPADGAAFGVLIAAPPGRPAPGPGDFYLSAGRYYVDGLQCELEAPVLYTKQPDRLDVAALPAGNHLLVLDVWNRHLTALDDDAMREHALGGPDTATRAKIVWQVRAFALGGAAPTCAAEPAGFTALIDPGTARLTAKTAAAAAPTDPCQVPENGGYTGLENQLYRVEIHDPSTAPGGASWKWSRENGSVVVAVEKIDPANAKRIFVSSVGADKETLGFKKGDIVELLDDANELESSPGQIAEVDDVDRDARVITLKTAIVRPAPAKPEGVDAARHPKLCRWEGFEKVQVNQFKPLEFSVQVRFDGGAYRNGHYWQIPARAATARSQRGEIEWPNDGAANPQPLSLAPRGIAHHFCKLGVINVSAAPALAVNVTSDCRCLWPALTLVPRLFYVSGDGQEVMPDLTDTTGKLYKLPQPLIVGLGNGHCAPQGMKVHFSVIPPNEHEGLVAKMGDIPVAQVANLPLGTDGMAQCDFFLDGKHYSQQVRAQLLDADGVPCSLPIIFDATLSIASEVAYNPGECEALKTRKNVQDAIHELAALVRIDKVGGDGQDTDPGQPVPNELIVLVSNACGPVEGATVTFTAADGFVAKDLAGITASTDITIDVTTDANGIAQCHWRTAAAPTTQQLLAEITTLPGGLPMEARQSVLFTANLRAQEGGGCCVTVGETGQFKRLDLAIKELAKQKLRDICICLLPGDHEAKDISLANDGKGDLHLHIAGCGRGTRLRLKQPTVFDRLTSFTMRELEIFSDAEKLKEDLAAFSFDSCEDVTITACRIAGVPAPGALLAVHDADRVRLADNFFEAAAPNSLDPTIDVFTQIKSFLATLFAMTEWPDFNHVLNDFGAQLADLSRNDRATMRTNLQTALNKQNNLSFGESFAFSKFMAALADDTTAATYADLLRDIRAAGIKARPGIAVVLGDAVAPTKEDPLGMVFDEDDFLLMENNEITGVVCLMGQPEGGLTSEEIKAIDALLHKVIIEGPQEKSFLAVGIIGLGGTLELRGNQLTRLGVAKGVMDQLRKVPKAGRGIITGVFGRCLLTDNVIEALRSVLVCEQLSLTANKFTRTAEIIETKTTGGTVLGGTSIADNAVFVGNQARRLTQELPIPELPWLNASRVSDKAANVGLAVGP